MEDIDIESRRMLAERVHLMDLFEVPSKYRMMVEKGEAEEKKEIDINDEVLSYTILDKKTKGVLVHSIF